MRIEEDPYISMEFQGNLGLELRDRGLHMGQRIHTSPWSSRGI